MRAVLLAHPAGHSLSPVLHDAAFAACGMDARYEAWDVPPERLADAVARLRSDGAVLGANVSVPHKRAVIDLLDELRPAAAAIGAVNVLVRDGTLWIGDNSDAEGFLRSVREAGAPVPGGAALLIGAGGAARAVGFALLEEGAASLQIVNRTAEAAERLAHDLASRFPDAEVAAVPAPGLRSAADGADLIVNATSVGMARHGVDPDASPLPAEVLDGLGTVRERWAVDLVYRPRRTRYLRDAAAAGFATVDGLGMLLHQGAVAFEAWTGRPAPLEAMRAALTSALPDPSDARP
ncbi:MAG: shikimate dehydrogenase [Trueperaceae bacterium]